MGVPVSMVEAIDAAEALRHVDMADREAFKAALGATLVKNQRHMHAFDVAFEVYFGLAARPVAGDGQDASRRTAGGDCAGAPGSGDGPGGGDPAEGLMASIVEALVGQRSGSAARPGGAGGRAPGWNGAGTTGRGPLLLLPGDAPARRGSSGGCSYWKRAGRRRRSGCRNPRGPTGCGAVPRLRPMSSEASCGERSRGDSSRIEADMPLPRRCGCRWSRTST